MNGISSNSLAIFIAINVVYVKMGRMAMRKFESAQSRRFRGTGNEIALTWLPVH